MSRALINCKHIPGWVKPVLLAVANGKNDMNAAQMAGVSTRDVIARLAKDPAFKEQYEAAAEQGIKRKMRGMR